MKVTAQGTLYHEDHGATLKHKCGKRDSSIVPSLFFSHFIFFLFFFFFFSLFFSFWPFSFFSSFSFFFSFFFVKSEVSSRLLGESQSSSSFPHLGRCSNNEDHHTFINLQIKVTTQYLEQNMTLYECLRRCTGICNESRVTCMKNYEGGLATNTMSTT